MSLTLSQLYYIAGFLDCDGSIIAQIVPRSDYKNLFQIRLTLSFHQKLQRIHFLKFIAKELGVNSKLVRDRGDGMAELNIVGWQTVQPLLQLLKPCLRMKRRQARLVLRIIEQLPLAKHDLHKFLELCVLADKVGSLNDSKNREHTAITVRKEYERRGLI